MARDEATDIITPGARYGMNRSRAISARTDVTPVRLPARVVLVLSGVAIAGAASLALTYPPDRTIGLMYEVENDLGQAITYLSSWNAAHPTDFDSRFHTADLLEQAARPREAVEVLEAMARDWPMDEKVIDRLVRISESLLDLERTLIWTERIARIEPDNPAVLRRLVNYYRYFNRTDFLIETLEHHLEIESVPEEHRELTRLLLSLHRYQGLIDYYRERAKKDPEALEPHLALYQAYLDTKAIGLALVELDTITKLKPDSTELVDDLFDMRAKRLLRAGQIDEAVKLYRARIAENPKSIRLRLKLAELYGTGAGADKAAIAELEELVKVAPGSLPGWTALAERLSWAGRSKESAAAYQKAVILSPKNTNLHRALAQQLAWSNQRREALEHYRWLDAHGGNEADRAALIEILVELHSYPEAIATGLELVRKSPDRKDYYRLLAEAAVASKRCGDVFAALTEMTRRLQEDSETWSLYGLCAKQLGRTAEARDALQKANKLHREQRGTRR